MTKFIEKFGAKAVVPKPKDPDPFTWYKVGSGFVFDVPGIKLEIFHIEKTWEMVACIGDKQYRGTRPSLDEAFKTLDKVLYKTRPEVWLKVRAANVLNEFQGDLDNLETQGTNYG